MNQGEDSSAQKTADVDECGDRLPGSDRDRPVDASAEGAFKRSTSQQDLKRFLDASLSFSAPSVPSAKRSRKEAILQPRDHPRHETNNNLSLERSSFQARLATFQPLLWSSFNPVSPLECARYGWNLVSVDLLKCVSCGAVLVGKLASSSDPFVFQKSVEVLRSRLVTGHVKFCKWSALPSPESFFDLSFDCLSHVDELIKSVLLMMSKFGSFLPRFSLMTQSKIITNDILNWLCSLAILEIEDEGVRSAVLLVLTGWVVEGSERVPLITCRICNKKCGAWMYQTTKDPLLENSEEIFPDESELIVAETISDVLENEIGEIVKETISFIANEIEEKVKYVNVLEEEEAAEGSFHSETVTLNDAGSDPGEGQTLVETISYITKEIQAQTKESSVLYDENEGTTPNPMEETEIEKRQLEIAATTLESSFTKDDNNSSELNKSQEFEMSDRDRNCSKGEEAEETPEEVDLERSSIIGDGEGEEDEEQEEEEEVPSEEEEEDTKGEEEYGQNFERYEEDDEDEDNFDKEDNLDEEHGEEEITSSSASEEESINSSAETIEHEGNDNQSDSDVIEILSSDDEQLRDDDDDVRSGTISGHDGDISNETSEAKDTSCDYENSDLNSSKSEELIPNLDGQYDLDDATRHLKPFFNPLNNHLPWCSWVRDSYADPTMSGWMMVQKKLQEIKKSSLREDAGSQTHSRISAEQSLQRIRSLLNSN